MRAFLLLPECFFPREKLAIILRSKCLEKWDGHLKKKIKLTYKCSSAFFRERELTDELLETDSREFKEFSSKSMLCLENEPMFSCNLPRESK